MSDLSAVAQGLSPAFETYGGRELRLTIGGITVAALAESSDLKLSVEGAPRYFIAPQAQPDTIVRVAWGDRRTAVRGVKVFDSGGVWQLYRDGDRSVFHFTSPKFGPIPYKIASFQHDFSAGEVLLHRPYFDPSDAFYPLEYPLDELLVINLLAQGKGVEIHGCGVIDRSGASYLFAGHSGAGKTTMARLWREERGVTILSDDRVILRRHGRAIWMYGTPWHGDEPLASPTRALLTRAFFLRHALSNEVSPVTGVSAAARLFACCFPPFHSAAGLECTLGLLAEITEVVPFHELGFTPDPAVVDFVRR